MKEYKKYLEEKLGTDGVRKATEEEIDSLVGIIAKSIIQPDSELRKYVSDQTIHSANAIDIVKELFQASIKNTEIDEIIMNLEDLWDFDSEDLKELKQTLQMM